MWVRTLKLADLSALYLPWLPDPLQWKAEPVILDAGLLACRALPKALMYITSITLSSRPGRQVSLLAFHQDTQGLESWGTFARLQRKWVTVFLATQVPPPALRLLLDSVHGLPAYPPSVPHTASQRCRTSEAQSRVKKVGWAHYCFLILVYTEGINIHPGAAEIHSTGTMTGEKGTGQICLQWLIQCCLSLHTAWLYEWGESLITDWQPECLTGREILNKGIKGYLNGLEMCVCVCVCTQRIYFLQFSVLKGIS
jgi:hypothetical protein